MGEMLALAQERGGAVSEVLHDGSRVQQVIAQLHGAQRRKLGWSEEALRRDLEILRETIEEEARKQSAGEESIEEALEVLARILQRGERTSRRAWRLAGPQA